ncbi:MAG: hypothetical protein ABI488_16610 [Polyangiaceae bacterium]
MLGYGGLALLAVAASACGAGTGTGAYGENAEEEDPGVLNSLTAALDSSTICSVVNKIASVVLVGQNFAVSVGCGDDNTKTTAYLGSSTKVAWAKSTTVAETQALYCAIQATDRHNAIALIDTPLGKFGIQSRIAILKADAPNLHVKGQRIGQLVAFDQYLDTESQTFDFDHPTEWQPAQSVIAKRRDAYPLPPKTYYQSLPAQRGQYSVMTTNGHHYHLGANAEYPIAGVFNGTMSLDFRNATPYDGHNAFAYAMSPQSAASAGYGFETGSEDARRDSFHALQVACKACNTSNTSNLNVCPVSCPDAKMFEDHFRTCGTSQGFAACTDDYYSNLTDGRLPYEGTYGASGSFADTGPVGNWWHFGAPKDSQIVSNVPGEPVYSLLSSDPKLSSPTTHLGFGLGVNASVKIFKLSFGLDAQFDFRDGLAVREAPNFQADSHNPDQSRIQTWVDAEARAVISASVKVTAKIPVIGEKTLTNMSFNVLDKSVRSSSNAARYGTEASWTNVEPSEITSYQVGGVETDIASCLNAPVTSKPEIQVNNPKDVAGSIMDQARGKIYPCDIVICDPTTKTRNTCTYNTADSTMACTDTGKSCSCGDTSMSMCVADSAGKVTKYAGTPQGQNYCDQQAACGAAQVCTTAQQCPLPGAICFVGCCATNPK